MTVASVGDLSLKIVSPLNVLLYQTSLTTEMFIFFPLEDEWTSYCLSSLAAHNICSGNLGNPWAHLELASLYCSVGSTSCSFLNVMSVEESLPSLPAAVRNPNKAVFTVDVRTTEVQGVLDFTTFALRRKALTT